MYKTGLWVSVYHGINLSLIYCYFQSCFSLSLLLYYQVISKGYIHFNILTALMVDEEASLCGWNRQS